VSRGVALGVDIGSEIASVESEVLTHFEKGQSVLGLGPNVLVDP
jgi:hypothetical protein